jgi:hypothetical protein
VPTASPCRLAHTRCAVSLQRQEDQGCGAALQLTGGLRPSRVTLRVHAPRRPPRTAPPGDCGRRRGERRRCLRSCWRTYHSRAMCCAFMAVSAPASPTSGARRAMTHNASRFGAVCTGLGPGRAATTPALLTLSLVLVFRRSREFVRAVTDDPYLAVPSPTFLLLQAYESPNSMCVSQCSAA